MYYYNKNSRLKIVHTENCHYIKNKDNVVAFETLGEAHREGYRLCKHCNQVLKLFKKEKTRIGEFCQTNGMTFKFVADHILVDSIHDRWILSPTYKGSRVALYHENKFNKNTEEVPIYEGYHSQNKSFSNIKKALKYIRGHDIFREENPIYIKPVPKEPPRKGTKRYKNSQRIAKKIERNRAIWNVLTIIESFNFENANTVAI